MSSKFDTQRNEEVSALLGDEKAKWNVKAGAFLRGESVGVDLKTAVYANDKISFLSAVANRAESDKEAKAIAAYDEFYATLTTATQLPAKERVEALNNLLNSEGAKKLRRSDEYYSKIDKKLLTYTEKVKDATTNKEEVKTKVLKKKDDGSYAIEEEASPSN